MAISFVQGNKSGIPFTANTGASLTVFGSNATAGDLIACFAYLQNVSGSFNPVITDNVNTGNYTVDWTFYDAADSVLLALCHMVPNATGKPIVSIAGSTSYTGGSFNAMNFTGFAATPTYDSGAFTVSTATGTAITGSATTTRSPELVLAQAIPIGGGTYTPPTSPWSETFIGGAGVLIDPLYQLVGSAGPVSYSGTIGQSDHWYLILAPFYSFGAATPAAGAGPAARCIYVMP